MFSDLKEQMSSFKGFDRKLNRKPFKVERDILGTLSAKRNSRIAIREAALRGVTMIILYKREQNGQVKRYEVVPLSYRFRRLKAGLRKVLFCQDVNEKGQVKFFLMRNIFKVALTKKKSKPKWPVEIY